ncbi:MAG: GNAT family N-acetyltransferase [Actinomycetota bacterium]
MPPSPSSADSIELRPLGAAELEAASILAFEANDGLEAQPDSARAYMPNVTVVRADLVKRLATSALVGAWIGGRLAGVVNYVEGPQDPYAEFGDPDAAGIRQLAVGTGWQRRGVGAALVKYCIERARAEGKVRIVLHTTPWMQAAQRLYPRLGFTRTPELDFLPEPDLPLLGYTLELG